MNVSRRGRRESNSKRRTPALVFVSQQSSGPSRRMESLVAWVKVTQKKRLRVIDVDADENPIVVRSLDVSRIPALVLIKDRRVLGRLEGRATGQQIDDLIRPHLAA
ncbi:MAG: thioredoxin family protein [Actinobacteria bacterium]|nr:MAG: thioredoxin family protein [Actinomycetota bacterium]